jgi:DNA-3-methyladenine glycosylase
MSPEAFFNRPAETVARDLIGVDLRVDGVGGIIVETEAYDALDPASHSFAGPTPRNAPMFGPPGRAYVYRIYGLHWCFNVVCDAARQGSAILIRALEPRAGLAVMRRRRGVEADTALCSGPGKLCEALGIDGRLSGADLARPPFAWTAAARVPAVVKGVRIGISRGAEAHRRFGLAGSRHLSRPLRAPEAIL